MDENTNKFQPSALWKVTFDYLHESDFSKIVWYVVAENATNAAHLADKVLNNTKSTGKWSIRSIKRISTFVTIDPFCILDDDGMVWIQT